MTFYHRFAAATVATEIVLVAHSPRSERRQAVPAFHRPTDSASRLPETMAEQPLALGRDAAAAALGISADLLDRMEQAGKIPAPIRLGKRKLYSRTELEAWLAAGAPNRAVWERMRVAPSLVPQRPRR